MGAPRTPGGGGWVPAALEGRGRTSAARKSPRLGALYEALRRVKEDVQSARGPGPLRSMAMGPNPNRSPSEHPNPTTKLPFPFLIFCFCWGPHCFPLTRQKRYCFAGVVVPAK